MQRSTLAGGTVLLGGGIAPARWADVATAPQGDDIHAATIGDRREGV